MSERRFDYSRVTLSEIRADLVETLSDRAINAGHEELVPYLDALEDDALVTAVEKMTESTSAKELRSCMAALLEHDHEPRWSPEAIAIAHRAVGQLLNLAGMGPDHVKA